MIPAMAGRFRIATSWKARLMSLHARCRQRSGSNVWMMVVVAALMVCACVTMNRARDLCRLTIFRRLLISENWDDAIHRGLVADYHDWYAASLLAHQNISAETRQRLEHAACKRPTSLLSNYPLIPEIIDRDAIDVALVSAKLMNAG